MALIQRFVRRDKETNDIHVETQCAGYVFRDKQGRPHIQLDTFGSKDRKLKGKVSQSMQFNEQSAGQLLELILEAFPRLRKS